MERGNLSWEDVPVGKFVGYFLDRWLTWEGSSHCWQGIHRPLVLSYVQKQVKQASKKYSSKASASGSWRLPFLMNHDKDTSAETNPFFLKLLSVMGF